MRLYFHLTDDRNVIPDHRGLEVDSLEEALVGVQLTIREIRLDYMWFVEDWSGWTLIITDDDGQVLISLDLTSWNGGSSGRPSH